MCTCEEITNTHKGKGKMIVCHLNAFIAEKKTRTPTTWGALIRGCWGEMLGKFLDTLSKLGLTDIE